MSKKYLKAFSSNYMTTCMFPSQVYIKIEFIQLLQLYIYIYTTVYYMTTCVPLIEFHPEPGGMRNDVSLLTNRSKL